VEDEVVSRHVGLAEDLRGELALVPVASTPEIGFSENGPPPLVRFMIPTPISWKRFMIRARACSSVSSSSGVTSTRSGPIAEDPTMNAACAVADWTSPPTPFEFSP